MNVRFIIIICSFTTFTRGLPDLRDNTREPLTAIAGQEAILTCNVKNLENNTVIWKRIKNGRPDVLTAGNIRVTSDVRFSVINSKTSGDWLLSINPTRVSDTAQYVCEINSSPAVRFFQLLTVTNPGSLPLGTPFPLTHNFTECCVMKNVPDGCLGFCSLRNIVLGATGSTTVDCEDHLASIAFCMADGKNHEPCCIRERVPESCREVCRGEYTLQTASVIHHYACSHYSSATLACIAQGVELLPPPPRDFVVEPMSDREIRVKWKLPAGNLSNIDNYILNITEMKGFDEMESSVDVDGPMGEEEEYFPADGAMAPEKPKIERQGRKKNFVEKFTEIKINSTETTTVLKDLKPFTMYEIYLTSVNGHGSSLPTYRLRALTLMAEVGLDTTPANATLPDLPDIRGCCVKNGLPMESCINRFCDPKKTDDINLTDMMICAPWVGITLPCLTQGKDHTPCCIQRGLPSLCINLCHGNISRIDYQYFQCLPYMPIFANCLMEGYDVLPSAPKDLRIQHISSSWVVLYWQPPDKLTETVLSYNVHYRSLSEDEKDGVYTAITNAKSPYLLNNLKPGTDYEVYVRAVNDYGVSQASPRALFKTEKVIRSLADSSSDTSVSSYNMSECCAQSGVSQRCLPVCNFRAKLSEVKELVPHCLDEMHKMLRCGAGGRNHVPCCQQRQVNKGCLELCAGVITQTMTNVASLCVASLIDIVECLEQGTGILPGPVTNFQVVAVNATTVSMEWKAPVDSNTTGFEVHYRNVNQNNTSKTILVNNTNLVLGDLDGNSSYVFFVVSSNDYGTSIASSLVFLNISLMLNGEKYWGTPSPPEAVSIGDRNTTSLTIVWLPPAFTHPLDHLRYKLYYRSGNQTVPNSLTTVTLGAVLNNLSPNTEYEISVTALTDKGESPPAETLQAWTDVAFPAYVETPHIHPSSQVVEGSNMTVLCVAMGNPVPTISFFVNGVRYAMQKTRHLVAQITNVTRAMALVVCHAENGYGLGMQSSRRVYVSYGPTYLPAEHVTAIVGQQAVLTCLVNANPEPHMSWWRDIDERNQILNGDHYLLKTGQLEGGSYSMHLAIINVSTSDEGTYYCHSQNPFGRATQTVSLKVDPVPSFEPGAVRDCCVSQGVSAECMDACSYDIDIDSVITRSQCIPEIHKLMYCAADGSDHRRCCMSWGVPRRCIGWCQGKSIHHGAMCILGWSKQIVSCFKEGRSALPGPPQNVRVEQLSTTIAKIVWDLPDKNPQSVDFYRVQWKKMGPGRVFKLQNDTQDTSLMVYNMIHGASYEVSVKAFNRKGSSSPSVPFNLVMNGEAGSAEGITASSGEQIGLAVGLIFAILLVVLIAAVVFLYYRRKTAPKLAGGVSFENPSYMKDGNSDTVQIANSMEHNSSTGMGGWKHEALHTPTDIHSVTTGVYEELRNETSDTDFKHSREII